VQGAIFHNRVKLKRIPQGAIRIAARQHGILQSWNGEQRHLWSYLRTPNAMRWTDTLAVSRRSSNASRYIFRDRSFSAYQSLTSALGNASIASQPNDHSNAAPDARAEGAARIAPHFLQPSSCGTLRDSVVLSCASWCQLQRAPLGK
jgi:hypothetical protein